MKTPARRRLLELPNKEACMEACLLEREFECRSANWYRRTRECTLSDQDRHSVSQSEAGDQQVRGTLADSYGPSNATWLVSQPAASGGPPAPPTPSSPGAQHGAFHSASPHSATVDPQLRPSASAHHPGSLYEYFTNRDGASIAQQKQRAARRRRRRRKRDTRQESATAPAPRRQLPQFAVDDWPPIQYAMAGAHAHDLPANAPVDYLENNCVYEPNKLCEFRKIQNRVLKTVDSVYQDVNSLDECKHKCLNAPYRCYSFDYGDTAERVCRTSHLDQASLMSVKEPYLDVVGAITYELASCFNVTIQCRARDMVAQVSASKSFKGKIYAKSRPSSCVNDVRDSLKFELSMRYNDPACDVRATSNAQQGVFSNDIVIQHHDRIVTTQDVGLSVYCQYDLGNRSITNNVDLAIERIATASPNSSANAAAAAGDQAKQRHPLTGAAAAAAAPGDALAGSVDASLANSPLTITSLATTVVRSPNVTMRITNMNGQPVSSATVGDRLALLFEIKEKSSKYSAT